MLARYVRSAYTPENRDGDAGKWRERLVTVRRRAALKAYERYAGYILVSRHDITAIFTLERSKASAIR